MYRSPQASRQIYRIGVRFMSDMTHLDALEAEAIYIMREVVAECEKPVMLYSIGKDSSVMLLSLIHI